MRKVLVCCCLFGMLMLSACAPASSTVDMTNWAQKLNPQTGGADAEAEALRKEILNTKDNPSIIGVTYYISPNGDDTNDGTTPETAWKTPEALFIYQDLLQPGDAVLFERGGVYRTASRIIARDGVTYGAYGKGNKPAIYGSAANYAEDGYWEPSGTQNIWKTTAVAFEAGLMVFNHGEQTGTPKYYGVHELTQNGDFHYGMDDCTLYLYMDKGNPSDIYDDIEIGTRESIFVVPQGLTDVTFDNLTVKYTGLYGLYASTGTKNIRITNCEVGWAGGVRYAQGRVGLGNGVSYGHDIENILVENCWIYQCYDAGITPQGLADEEKDPHFYKNLVFRKNLIEFCNYSIEIFDREADARWEGLLIEDNVLRFAGYGFMAADKRPDNSYAVAHYTGWSWNYDELPGDGIIIRNNIFDCSADNLVFWIGKTYDSGLEISGNSFYQKANRSGKVIHFAENGLQLASNQAELEAAVYMFDPHPKEVKWLG